MAINPKHKKFVLEYIKSGNATESYVKAGYSGKNRAQAAKNAYALLQKKEIKELLDKEMTKMEKTKIAEAEEVLEFLTNVMKDEGQETRDRIKSAELLGKRYKLFTDKTEISSDNEIEINLSFEPDKD